MKATMPIELPFNLKHDELVITDRPYDHSEVHPMDYLIDSVSWDDDTAMETIMRGAVCLYNRPDNIDSFTACLEQSVIWYAG